MKRFTVRTMTPYRARNARGRILLCIKLKRSFAQLDDARARDRTCTQVSFYGQLLKTLRVAAVRDFDGWASRSALTRRSLKRKSISPVTS